MKKIIEKISLLCLICFSFFYTDKVINIINKKDPLMMEIINIKDNYEVLPVNAVINDDTIIPGINGKEINIDKSYNNMKSSRVFREEELVFNELYPTDNLYNNKDKYIISGNTSKKEVAIISIYDNRYINKIKNIDNITIFINHNDLTISNINNLKNKEIYSYGDNGIYSNEIITNDNTLINRLSNNKSNYCLVKNKNNDILSICNKNNMYVVLPNIIGDYYNIRNNISNGSIILLDSLNNIDIIIKYINSKGYNIVTLSKLLS